MTGNTKVWRAPLAGLASVAMIATMGVAASTASAVEPTKAAAITFVAGDSKYVWTESGQIDGKVDGAELASAVAEADAELQSKIPAGETFTGWFDGDAAEAVMPAGGTFGREQVNPDGTSATTLTAHSSKSVYTVTFDTQGVVKDGVTSALLAMSTDNVLDKLPAWAVPTTDVNASDGHVMYNKDGKLAADASWKSNGTVVDPTGDLYPDAFTVDGGAIETNATLVANPADSYTVTFHTADANNGTTGDYSLKTSEGDKFTNPAEVAEGEAISDYVDFPKAERKGTPTFTATDWYNGKAKNSNEFEQLVKVGNGDLMPAYKLDLYPSNATSTTKVTLNYNATIDGKTSEVVYAPANEAYTPASLADITTDDAVFHFEGWYTDNTFKTAYKPNKLAPNALWAKWSVAAVRFTVRPNYGNKADQDLWVDNEGTFVFPTESDLGRDGWTATWDTYVYGKDKKTVIDNFTLYATGDGTAYTTTTVTLQYTSTNASTDTKYQLYTNNGELKPGDAFKVTSWTQNTDLKSQLREMEQYVVVKDGGKYIKGSAQDDFTAASYDEYVKAYQAYDAAAYKENTVADLKAKIAKLAAIQAKLVEVGDLDLYRVYNPNNGDHYYTVKQSEQAYLVKLGWRAEGTPYKVVSDRNATFKDGKIVKNDRVDVSEGLVARHNFGEAVYSAYNPNTGEHLLASQNEAEDLANVGWNNEGVKYYAPQGASTAVYRIYNPNTEGPAHAYVDQKEGANVVKLGWKWDNSGSPVYHFD